MQLALAILLLASPIALAGCYETPQPACAFTCGQGDDCPDGYSCRADTWCKRDDVTDDHVCAPPRPDAAGTTADAAPPDATPADATPPDAGQPDAGPDSAPPDASELGAPATTPLPGS